MHREAVLQLARIECQAKKVSQDRVCSAMDVTMLTMRVRWSSHAQACHGLQQATLRRWGLPSVLGFQDW